MKLSSLILGVSIASNVILVAVLLVADPGRIHAASSDKSSAPAVAPSGETAAQVSAAANRSTPRSGWKRLKGADDLFALVQRLRVGGYPPAVVRAMITALVAEQFDAERYQVDAVALKTPFWKMWPNSYQDPKTGPELRRLNREQQSLVQQLLGDTRTGRDTTTEEGRAFIEQEFGDVPPEKWDQLTSYLDTFQEKRAQLLSTGGQTNRLSDAALENLGALDKEMRDGLAKFLTPDEANEVILRNSDAAGKLKWMLGSFAASEEEYRVIFPAYQAYASQFPSQNQFNSANNGPVDPVRKMAEDALIAQLASRLGQQRAEELRLALDPQYSGLNRLITRLDLPLSSAKQVFEVQRDIQQRAAAIHNNSALATDARAGQLAALAQEASTEISAALGGADGFETYKQNGGQWLISLTPAGP